MIAKQMDIRANIKKYFDMAYSGDVIFVPRKGNKNVVIISEDEYNKITRSDIFSTYATSVISHASAKRERAVSTGSLKTDNLKKLEVIHDLKDGWNGNGAPAFSKSLIVKAGEIIKGLSIQPEIFPTALGSIQLEYDNSRHDHMEIEIGDGSEAEVFISTYDGKEFFGTVSANSDDINRKAIEFYG